MGRQALTYVRAGDTEPLAITIGAEGASNLDDVTSVVLYARKEGASANHVDGATCSVSDSAAMTVSFDPEGNGPEGADAFAVGDDGRYDCYVLITWSDGDETRHPARDDDTLDLVVTEAFE